MSANSHILSNGNVRTNPDIILNNYFPGCERLLSDWNVGVFILMIGGHNCRIWTNDHVITDLDTA
ncbi:hypothetical protein D3C72_2364200 [compost metagenome]